MAFHAGARVANVLRLDAAYTGHTGACVPSGTGGRAQHAGVSDSTAACLTKVRRPCGVSISSSRSATSAWLGIGAVEAFRQAAEAA